MASWAVCSAESWAATTALSMAGLKAAKRWAQQSVLQWKAVEWWVLQLVVERKRFLELAAGLVRIFWSAAAGSRSTMIVATTTQHRRGIAPQLIARKRQRRLSSLSLFFSLRH
jgi:hypothetical protein